MSEHSDTLCKCCNKETYNETPDWSGFCSKTCEESYTLGECRK